MTPKIYIASGVWLQHIPDAHRGNNGNCQKFIMVKATSIRKVAELVGDTPRHLREFSGIHAVEPHEVARFCSPHKVPADIALKENVIYYKCEHCRNDFIDQWFEYKSN